MRRLALLLLAGCTARNPAYDVPNGPSAGSSGGAPSTGGESTPAPTTGLEHEDGMTGPASDADVSTSAIPADSTSTGPALDPSTTTTATTTTTADSTVDSQSDPTNPTCPGGCAACHTCVDELCIPAPGTPCDAPEGPACETIIAEYADNGATATCYSYAPSPATCNQQGECRYECQGRLELAECGSRCGQEDMCQPGLPAAGVDPDAFCVKNGPSKECKSRCLLMSGHYTHVVEQCNGESECADLAMIFCQAWGCELPEGCKSSCIVDQDCAPNAMCLNTVCTE